MSSKQPQGQGADQKITLQPQDPNARRDKSSAGSDPDVLLDSPQLDSDRIELEIEDVDVARIIRIGKVKANIEGLEAQLLLEVRLKQVVDLVDRLLDSVDRGLDSVDRGVKQVTDLIDSNPETLQSVAQIAGNLLGEVVDNGSEGQETNSSGDFEEQDATSTDRTSQSAEDSVEQEEAGQDSDRAQSNGSVGETVDEEGRTVQHAVDESWNIVETTLNGSGEIVDERTVGNLEDFLVEEEFFNEEGFIVSRMRNKTGFVIEGVLDQEGNIIDVNSV